MELKPIGVIHSPYKTKEEAPHQGRISDKEIILEIYPEYVEGVEGLEGIKHIIVLYFCHEARRDVLKTKTPFGPEIKGVFATRSPSRPNPIAFCVADVIKFEGNKIYVKGVDAIDKSPLIDIKPYIDLDRVLEKNNKNIRFDKKLWEECILFHGHSCPGLAIGFKAVEAVVKKLGITFSEDEEIVCITENNACGVDAIQYITGCTFGKGNLIFVNRGKQAFTFYKRETQEGIRIVLKNLDRPQDREAWTNLLLNSDVEEIFDFKPPKYPLPKKAKIYPSIKCEICGEKVAEPLIRIKEGKMVCIDCFEE